MPIPPDHGFGRKIACKILLVAGLVLAFSASRADLLDLSHYVIILILKLRDSLPIIQ